MARTLITGVAGFIGFHVARRLAESGESIIGIDNLSEYYDVQLKRARLDLLREYANIRFELLDLADRDSVGRLFRKAGCERVIHLAAQPGVRYSLQNPHAYIQANVLGFLNVLEGCRQTNVRHLVFASSSSVYGANTRLPFSVHELADHPVSVYGATKKAGELLAHAYAHLYRLSCTGLRFFTVYGPWGRPDMIPMLFARAILNGKPIDVYNEGKHKRDFTYVDDVVEGIVRIADVIPEPDARWNGNAPDPATSSAPYRLYNIGNHTPVDLMRFIALLEAALGKRAVMNLLPMQPGDLPETYADVEDLSRAIGFAPSTPLEVGIQRFVEWYVAYYGNQNPTM